MGSQLAPEAAQSPAAVVDSASIPLVEMTFSALSTSSRLTVLQARVLLAIHEHGSTNLQDLAVQLGVSTSSASRVVDRLVVAGLLSRGSAPHSRREIALSLTARGGRVLEGFHARRRKAIHAVLTELSEQDQDALVSGLQAFTLAASGVSRNPHVTG
jgi:DNA-binding MarR family transcriptional regulator